MKYVEGLVTINIPSRNNLTKKNSVFLNEHKKFDRDVNVLLLKSLGWKNKTYLELMSASGIRGLRIAKETSAFDKIVLNDYKKSVVSNIKKNAKKNDVIVEVFNKDANDLLHDFDSGVDYIDIDPYGSPIYFVNNAMNKLSRNGILGICATDTGALSGTFPKACQRRYHSKSFLSEFYYESGLRILAKSVIEIGSTKDVALVPIFAHATRHYFRMYFRKIKGAKKADDLMKKISYISYCTKCLHREVGIKLVCDCGNKLILIGPLFTGSLYDERLIKKMNKFGEYPTFFEKVLEESSVDVPWFYTTNKISKNLKVMEPRFKDLGYKRTHITPKGFKTTQTIAQIIKKFK